MAQYNEFINIDLVSAEALAHLQDNLVMRNLCAMDKTADYNQKANGYKVGDMISFKTNPVYEVKTFDERASDNTWTRDDTKVIVPQDIRSATRAMYIEKHFDVSVTLSAREKAMHFDQFIEEIVVPASKALANQCDAYIGTKLLQAQGLYASSAVIATKADLAQARKASEYQQLTDPKFIIMNTDLEATLLGSDWFNGYDNRGTDEAFRRGFMSETLGFNFYSSQNFPVSTHTNASGTAVTVASPTTTQNKIGTSTLYVTSATTAMNAGDRIIVAGCRRPMIVKTAVSATDTTIALVDPITELIPASAAITTVGGNAKALTFSGCILDAQSLGVAMPKLDTAEGMINSVVSDNGISIRVVQGYNQEKKISTMSFDLLIGAFALDPRRMTLLANAA